MLKVLSCFSWLYIFWFLHQTTTLSISFCFSLGCISFDSYIKPQLMLLSSLFELVVYLLIPTSNHNRLLINRYRLLVVYLLIPTSNHNYKSQNPDVFLVVYLLIPTSNHNYRTRKDVANIVVYLLIPTSNHNLVDFFIDVCVLYIFWFLHQTTTNWYESILY